MQVPDTCVALFNVQLEDTCTSTVHGVEEGIQKCSLKTISNPQPQSFSVSSFFLKTGFGQSCISSN